MNNSTSVYLIPTLLAPDTQHKAVPMYNAQIVASLRYFFVENIRTARRFISSLNLGIAIDTLIFEELNKDTPVEQVKTKLQQLTQIGCSVGMLSEAGSPCIADPGNILVSSAHELGIKVVPLVGASSILLALIASGLNGQSFTFLGYVPIENDKKVRFIKQIEKESAQKGQTQIFMETPYRNQTLWETLLQHCQPHTQLCVATDISAEQEYIKTQTTQQWQKETLYLHKKPTIFLLQAT